MSKFFEALERAEAEEARRPRVSPAHPSAAPAVIPAPPAPSGVPAPPAPSGEVPPAAAPRLEPAVFEPPTRATAVAVEPSTRVAAQLVSLLNPGSFEAEQYRVLRHVVETMRKDLNLQIVGVTSPGVGEGKTTTAINLAGALAQSATARVLLVDLDIRRPAVRRQLGFAGSKRSIVDALRDSSLTLEDVAEYLVPFNLSVVLGSRPAVSPYELLKSPRLEALLDEARQRYDYVVLDTPPFVPVPDGRLVAKWVDGFLIVVAAHRTPRGQLAQTLHLIDPAKAMGLVFNGDTTMRPSSYYNVRPEPPGGVRWRRAWSRP